MNRERLFARLGPSCYDALVEATAMGRTRQHAVIDLDHWAMCLLQREHSDFTLMIAELGDSPAQVLQRLRADLARVTVSGGAVRDISRELEQSVAPAITWSQICVPAGQVRSGHLLLAWMDQPAIARWLGDIAPKSLGKLDIDTLATRFEQCGRDWPEAREAGNSVAHSPAADLPGDAGAGENPLERWGSNLSRQAAAGELDPVVGRHQELLTVIDILLRRRQNNPILVGEAGVGKTAVVEALAQKLLLPDVPEGLRHAQVWALDLTRMQAGASVRGEFEQRLRTVIDTVVASEHPIILFCDEAHTLIGAGGAAGTGDAVNLIKPMLARGQLRMIAATTWAEYKQFIEPDSALTRRFQAVPVNEPDAKTAVDMLRILAPRFARHHGVQIADRALAAAVNLSRRYLPARQLPDKAISVLDTACARVAMSQVCAPSELERLRFELGSVEQALHWQAQDRRLGLPTAAADALQARSTALQGRISELDAELVTQRAEIQAWAQHFDENSSSVDAPLLPVPADGPRWVHPWVDEASIAEVLSEWSGVPCSALGQSDAQRLQTLPEQLRQRIQGQDAAIDMLARSLQVAHIGLGEPNRPLGVVMLTGPTGTGKSQTAQALAELLFGGASQLVQFNMNEFQEAHTVSTLKGAPPGYVGYGKGGRLTEALRKKPYCVLLLDEFDRAHPDVHDVFYQAFDLGWMEDAEGRHISLRNCLILLTSNAGDTEVSAALAADPALSQARLDEVARQRLQKTFAPPLLARMQVLAYRPLDAAALTVIALQCLADIGQRLQAKGLSFSADPNVAPWIAQAVSGHPAGGRAVQDLLRQHVMPQIAQAALHAQASGEALDTVRLMADEGLSLSFESPAPAEPSLPAETTVHAEESSCA